MADLQHLLERLSYHSSLACLSTPQILAFFRLASGLKDDILLTQPAEKSMDEAPLILPPSVVLFLGEATAIPPRYIQKLWKESRFVLWSLPSADQAKLDDEHAFIQYGLHRGISEHLPRTHLNYHLIFIISSICDVSSAYTLCKSGLYR